MTSDCRIRHYGNTANNAYFNHLILEERSRKSHLPIRVFSESHAMSKAAWEEIAFIPPGRDWLDAPSWRNIGGARRVNRRFHAPDSVGRVRTLSRPLLATIHNLYRRIKRLENSFSPSPVFKRLFWKPLKVVRWFIVASALAIFAKAGLESHRLSKKLVRISAKLFSRLNWIWESRKPSVSVIYGSSFLSGVNPRLEPSTSIFFEQGNLRWLSDPTYADPSAQEKWRTAVIRGRHLWVTNLDPPSLEMADEIVAGKWSAFPHPYKFVRRPKAFAGMPTREDLMNLLDADFLVYLPASQNWKTPHHNKGSEFAWRALAKLRKEGLRVGVVASEWGLDLNAAKTLLDQLGIAKNVSWMVPLPRIPMLQLLGEVDVCWDQFVIQGFGGVALRAIEAGTPLVGQGLTKEAQKLTGFQVPWHIARNSEEIFDRTLAVWDEKKRVGRDELAQTTRSAYHKWFDQHHSPDLVGALQDIVFKRVIDGNDEPIARDLWAQMTRENEAK